MDFALRTQSQAYNPGMLRIMNAAYHQEEPQWSSGVAASVAHPVWSVKNHPAPMAPPKVEYDYVHKAGNRPVWDRSTHQTPAFRAKYNLPKREATIYYQPEVIERMKFGPVTHELIPENPEVPQAHLLFSN